MCQSEKKMTSVRRGNLERMMSNVPQAPPWPGGYNPLNAKLFAAPATNMNSNAPARAAAAKRATVKSARNAAAAKRAAAVKSARNAAAAANATNAATRAERAANANDAARRSTRAKKASTRYAEGYNTSGTQPGTANNAPVSTALKEKIEQVKRNATNDQRTKIATFQQMWKLQTNAPVWRRFVTWSEHTNQSINSVINMAWSVRNKFEKPEQIANIFESVRKNNSAHIAPATAHLPMNKRLRWAFQNAVTNERARLFTTSLRQARSGSLFEQVGIAVAAAATNDSVHVLFWDDDNDFPPINIAGDKSIGSVWTTHQNLLRAGKTLLVLKARLYLGPIKDHETNQDFKKAWYTLVKEDANFTHKQPNYGTGLSRYIGIHANYSKWKGFKHVEPDAMLFRLLASGHLQIRVCELKATLGKPEGVPAEAAQLAKAGRVVELDLAAVNAPPIDLHLHFYPLRYGVANQGKVNYTDPYALNSKIAPHILEAFRLLGQRYRTTIMNDASFQQLTGMDPGIIKVVLDVFRRKEIYELYKRLKKYITQGAVSRGRPAALIQGFINVVNKHPDKIHAQYREQVKTLLKNARLTLVNAQASQNENLQAFKAREQGNVNGLRGAMKAANLLSQRHYTFKRTPSSSTNNKEGFHYNLGIGRFHSGGSSASNQALMNRMFAFTYSKTPTTMSAPEKAWRNLLEQVVVTNKHGQIIQVGQARRAAIATQVVANAAKWNGTSANAQRYFETAQNNASRVRTLAEIHSKFQAFIPSGYQGVRAGQDGQLRNNAGPMVVA
jgi:hypothetical protein